jgi:hypothetical protein
VGGVRADRPRRVPGGARSRRRRLERARGIALHQAVMIVPYYAETNPAFVALARRTIVQILTA